MTAPNHPMDIYIMRDGAQTGPFAQETIQRLLDQKSVAPADLAWSPGAADWMPLEKLLQPKRENTLAVSKVATPPEKSATPPPLPAAPPAGAGAVSGEPATAKQKAFLGYMGIAVSGDTGKEQAALLMHDAMENPKNVARLARWHEDRLRLHPDLFAAELQAKKENRANRFFELAETVGSECFDGLAKAHCQVLVGYLDVKFPNWDARESEATWSYFFPAIAEKFPDLVTKEWRGKLKYPTGPRVATELKDRASAGLVRRHAPSPIWALLKGLAIGVVVLSVIFGGLLLLKSWQTSRQKAAAVSDSASSSAPTLPPLPPPAKVAPPAVGPANSPADPPAPVPAPAAQAPIAATDGEPSKVTPRNPAPPPDPAMAIPPDGGTAGTPPTSPTTPAIPPSDVAPVTPPPSPGTPIAPLQETSANSAPAPAPAPKKTNVVLTKAVEVPLPFGRAMLPAGTQLKLVAQEGAVAKVSYLNMVVPVPVSSTDLNSDTP